MKATVDVPAKPWYTSTTVLLNVGTVLLVLLGALIDNAASLGIPASVLGWIAVANGVVNTLLRVFKTSQPIGPEGTTKSVSMDLPREVG